MTWSRAKRIVADLIIYSEQGDSALKSITEVLRDSCSSGQSLLLRRAESQGALAQIGLNESSQRNEA